MRIRLRLIIRECTFLFFADAKLRFLATLKLFSGEHFAQHARQSMQRQPHHIVIAAFDAEIPTAPIHSWIP